jgi:hypothetical protein
MCQPDGDGIGLSFGVGISSLRSPHHSMKHRSPLVLFLVVLLSSGLRGELEFSAFVVLPKSELFVLRDLEQDQTSGFLKLGQSFRGYTLKAFDQNREVISLEKEGKITDIRLKDSKVRNGAEVARAAPQSLDFSPRIVGPPSGHSSKVVGRIVVKDDGRLFFNGTGTDMSQLDSLLNNIKEEKGVIWYFYDAPSSQATEVAALALNAALEKRIPIKRFTNENLTEYVGLFDGKIHKVEPEK